MRRTLVLALCAAVAAAAVPAVSMTAARDVSAAPRPAASPSPVHWSPCPPDVVQYVPLECATLGVPLDYSKPDGRQIEVAITRVKSKNPAQRRGVLLTNPGGPGISGLDFPGLLAALGLPKSVLDTYDLIGMDPRGIGRSTPVSCGFTAEQERRGLFAKYAHSSADVVRESAYAQKIANQCATSKTASLLPYITTANTARDMDRIREALGEQKISYFGGSYGSYLGAVYTTLFPNQSDRIVIDSVLGPKGYDETAMRQFARGLADRFPDFAKFVVAHPEYRLGTTPLQVKAKFFELARKLRAEPAVNMDETAFRVAAFEALYADASMPQLAKLWQDIDAGNPVAPPQTYGDNAMSGRLHVICGDSRWPTSVSAYQRDALVDRIRYPMLGGASANIGPCAFWPNQHPEPPVKITSHGPSNVLVVQNERDPGTPLTGARKTRQALGHRARMITVDAGGHGVYPFTPSTCAKTAVDAFLVEGKLPARDLACLVEPRKK